MSDRLRWQVEAAMWRKTRVSVANEIIRLLDDMESSIRNLRADIASGDDLSYYPLGDAPERITAAATRHRAYLELEREFLTRAEEGE